MATRPPVTMPKLSRRSRFLLILAGIVVLALLLGARLLDTYIDWLWFGEVGARSVFTTVLLTRVALFFATGLLVGGLLAISLVIAYRTRPVFVPVSGADDPLARYRSLVVSRVRLFGIGIPVVAGLIAGASGQADWERVQLFFNGTNFGQTDPEFGLDIGFYAFSLPFYGWLLGWLFVAIVVAFLGALAAHYLFGGVRLAGRGGQISGPARVQLSVTIGLFVLLKAVEYFLDRYYLMLSDRNEPLFTGATYTDLNAVLPAKWILLCISVFVAVAFFVGAFLRNVQLPAIALVLLILSGVLVGWAFPAVLEQFQVRPNAIEKEAESIQRNMEATRYAFDLRDVDYREYAGKSEATPAEVRADQGTIPNIRLLDPSVLEPTFTQRVGRENFYGFSEKLDIDRYEVGGKTQDYIVATKEIKTSGLVENQRTWINRHLRYTHGNGFVAAPANTIDRALADADSEGGYPVAGTSDTQNPTGAHGIRVDEPRIYYGELTTDYAIVGGEPGKAPGEYDSANKSDYIYQGNGGVPIDNWINRLVFAAKEGERNILFSDAISDGSRIMYNRDPRDRVRKVAPWLTVDGDPYPAVIDGRIKWIVDGYTTISNFPYSQQTQIDDATQDTLAGVARQQSRTVNYIRNSVKATVDAFDGNVDLYTANEDDPVLKAWASVFPGIVKPSSEISPELRKHFRYPEDMFKIQRQLLTKYHVQKPTDFYSTETFWDVPADPTKGGANDPNNEATNQPAYYLLAQIPGQDQATFQLTSPLTPLRRQYLAAWVSVSSDPGTYGDMTVLRLPTEIGAGQQVEGPVQVQNRFQSDPRVARERTLFNNPQIDVIYGNLLTLPVAGGFLYVEPVYIRQKNENSFPQLARVLVSYGGKIGFDATLKGALDQVFGEGAGQAATGPEQGGNPPIPEPGDDPDQQVTPPADGQQQQPPADGAQLSPDAQAAATDMANAYKALMDARRNGDFAAEGRALAQLDAAYQRYSQAGTGGG
ncbi:hypothetical protein SAMN05421810_101963 [Amycolatopsis arida]|uniref:UPF0182 protein SAMN05421810_101963 n=1 Tax=Amycolatopsis arida TaxID=587909 RepID=A0A1I5MLS5_9PSEU|nr:UPF0182 family protein [Amycolatopsis arida]TDX94134.1 hypothetical protein CLV69_104595 [Amycolatopsis arida]SFP10542.1 hypothetical protein SAMN05421810_101963 [Amycolatopsis arida]